MVREKLFRFGFALVCLSSGFVYAQIDASLPAYYIVNTEIGGSCHSNRLTPPLINAFAAPDGAMRGLAYDGTYLWAANSGDGNSMYGPKIYRLDPDSGTVVNSYNGIVDYPCGLAWDGQYLWHSAYIAGMIYQLDTASMTVIKSFAAPTTHPFDLAFYGGYLYAVKGNQPVISVIDTSSGLEIDSIAATYSSPNVRPFGLTCVIRSAPQLWTSDGDYGSNLVNSWNIYTNVWVDQWAAEPTIYPSGLAYDSVNERLWVSCYNRDSIYVYDVSQVGIHASELDIARGFQIDASPNPFTHTTHIRYTIHDTRYTIQKIRNSNFEMRKYTMKIYDADGRLVKSFDLGSGIVNGESVVSWDGTDAHGMVLPGGVFFLKVLNNADAVKLVKLK